MLRGFGINEPEWKALHGVEWTKLDDRTYLFPNDALKLSDDQIKAYIAEARPMGQGVTVGPEDIAKACLFFASDDSEFVTGTSLLVDGGMHTGPRHAWDPEARAERQRIADARRVAWESGQAEDA